jgi:hypothetical protein
VRVARRAGHPSSQGSSEAITTMAWSSLKAVELATLTPLSLVEVVDQAHLGIERVRRTPHLAYWFLRHTGLSVS